MKYCVQDHIARNWQIQDLALDLFDSKSVYYTFNLMFLISLLQFPSYKMEVENLTLSLFLEGLGK